MHPQEGTVTEMATPALKTENQTKPLSQNNRCQKLKSSIPCSAGAAHCQDLAYWSLESSSSASHLLCCTGKMHSPGERNPRNSSLRWKRSLFSCFPDFSLFCLQVVACLYWSTAQVGNSL